MNSICLLPLLAGLSAGSIKFNPPEKRTVQEKFITSQYGINPEYSVKKSADKDTDDLFASLYSHGARTEQNAFLARKALSSSIVVKDYVNREDDDKYSTTTFEIEPDDAWSEKNLPVIHGKRKTRDIFICPQLEVNARHCVLESWQEDGYSRFTELTVLSTPQGGYAQLGYHEDPLSGQRIFKIPLKSGTLYITNCSDPENMPRGISLIQFVHEKFTKLPFKKADHIVIPAIQATSKNPQNPFDPSSPDYQTTFNLGARSSMIFFNSRAIESLGGGSKNHELKLDHTKPSLLWIENDYRGGIPDKIVPYFAAICPSSAYVLNSPVFVTARQFEGTLKDFLE